ncbi:PEP-CTERM sorting domain-containing protein [Akkermansiaceae bacterium]|nr:PEP-CTERM sorting domain-containing protein [Akkermansiaceae bacterium]
MKSTIQMKANLPLAAPMSSRDRTMIVLALVAVQGFATMAQAATMSVSSSAPSVDGADIAMLNTTGEGGQVPTGASGAAASTLWANRPVQGQTFTTLGNPAGYELTSVTLRNFSNVWGPRTDTWTVRIGTVSGTTFTPIATETSDNSITIAAGDYLTSTFDSPVSLDPNTLYGFDWGTDGYGFIIAHNVDSNYTGGTRFHHGSNSTPDDANLDFTPTGYDRIFHVDMTAVPEPSSFVLAPLGLVGFLGRRRR